MNVAESNVPAYSEFLIPWEEIDISIAEGLKKELNHEMNRDHKLFGREVKAIAKRKDCDDVLFELMGEGKFAVVHLTWKMSQEKDPEFPWTVLFENWKDVYENCIVIDSLDYLNEEF
ncbi:MAG: hypothetical protein R2830_10170 [Saprospiraceae bacterium]